MTTYHAYEIATDGSYRIAVDKNEHAITERLDEELSALGEDVETYAVGTVQADTPEAAMDKIRAGDWQYTQRA